MKVRVVDDEALVSPDPRNIRTYLRAHGWTLVEQGAREVWRLERDGEDYQVLAPSDQFADFRQQVAMLLYTLSAVEERSELDVLRDLSSLSFDIQRVHRAHSGTPGTLVIGEAVRAFAGARNLVKAAATSLATSDAQPTGAARGANQVDSLLRRVLTGPPESGSYVLSIWVPVPPEEVVEMDETLFDRGPEPFARAVTRRMNQGVAAARTAAERTRVGADGVGVEAFVGLESAGLTADLCEALYVLAGRRAAPLDVRFSWALDRPVTGVSSVEHFAPEHVEILHSAAEALKVRASRVQLRGRVQRLFQRRRHGGGVITIVDRERRTAWGREFTVHISLAKPEYDEALRAQQLGLDIAVTGVLRERPTGRRDLIDPQGLTVVEP